MTLPAGIVLIAVLCWAPVKGQSLAAPAVPLPPKGTNTAFILLPVGGDSALVRVGRALFRHHFAIRASDRVLGTVTTDERYDAASQSVLSFSALVTGRVVTLHGNARFGGTSGSGEPIGMRGGGALARQWQLMDSIAHAIGGNVTYGTQ